MKGTWRVAAFVLPMTMLPAAAPAQDACQIMLEQRTAKAGELYRIENDSGIRMSTNANFVSDSTANSTLRFAYMLPARRRPFAGVIVIKTSRKTTSQTYTKQTIPTVRIVRDAYVRTCGIRDIRDALFFWLPVRMPVNTEVPLPEYIYYHKTTSDFTQLALYDFHVNYRDADGRCVGTDDRKNGNREQFLFDDDKTLDNSLVLANLRSGLIAAAQAVLPTAAANLTKKIKADERLRKLTEKYIGYGEIETQMHMYQPDTQCIAINLPGIAAEEKLTLMLNDLEQRESGRRRYRREQNWTFTAR